MKTSEARLMAGQIAAERRDGTDMKGDWAVRAGSRVRDCTRPVAIPYVCNTMWFLSPSGTIYSS